MLRMNSFKAIVTLTAMAFVVGCSNTNSPVSLSGNDVQKSAAVGDKQFQDIAILGTNYAYGLSMEIAEGTSNYWIYKFNNGTWEQGVWEKTTHYGKAISVSNFWSDSWGPRRCWHINAQNQIWWGTWDNATHTGTNGTIPNPPNQVTLLDIGAGRNIDATGDNVWVKCANSSGTVSIWEYKSASGTWTNQTGTLTSILTVSANPASGTVGIAVANSNKLYLNDDQNGVGVWNRETGAPTVSTAAMDEGKIVCRYQGNIYQKKGTGSYTRVATNAGAGSPVSVDIYYLHYLGTANTIKYIYFP